ncbi:M1 family metallopeptidase [Couchioplanes caeruleus]|uniref:Aminopeptidase N n=2 Tax=Couchioplanes caeruleus TaxID=56438 RepID=A0A1K0FJ05_9ACTN|nr:M1 family metallopeptidase [Couchioplanes caeruleus]OJF12839.1 peptidase M1 [Couchioplanes caeruleus subsp. caeruleus]ROP30170.1 peptidase M1-like protein [Couchioplanes caeruleus]
MRAGIAAVFVAALALAGCTGDTQPQAGTSASAASGVPSGTAPSYAPGAAGAGDRYFPTYGNGGYDVAGYDLKLKYDTATGRLQGTATISATATQDLSSLHFDLAHLTASRVTVDGKAATARAEKNELVVTPSAGIVKDRGFTVVVEYAGVPEALVNKDLGAGGWQRTKDGGFAVGQPESASTWFPVNDHPKDKATFKLEMTVPDGVEALSNGVPGPRRTAGGWTTWTWTESKPMASYLTTVAIGQYRVQNTTHAGKPMVVAIPETLAENGPADQSLALTGEVADFLATKFGPYPFDSYGGVVIDDPRVPYALETQSRPVYGSVFFETKPDTMVVAHELAHQWFGNSVAITRWQDIWLNEGFARYAEWLWQEHKGGPTVQQTFDRSYGGIDWEVPIGDPGPARIFDDAVYDRGALLVHALRRTIGDGPFFALVQSWPAEHRDGNATTEQFIAAAEKASGKDLDAFFQGWLFGETAQPKP